MDVLSANEPFRFTTQHASPSRSQVRGEDLAQETRREIQRLVREASELVRSSKNAAEFWPAFSDRVMRATAAEAVVVWTFAEEIAQMRFRAGVAFDADFDDEQRTSHLRLVDEVAVHAEPVLVPPSTEAMDEDSASNPTASLAVLVPILVDGESEALLEIMMPTGAGPATQRGYLRFAAQMGDLAGEFLRTETLRRARLEKRQWGAMAERLAQVHESLDHQQTAVAIVDAAAETLDTQRVSFFVREGSSVRVTAISGVADFDSRSPAVKSLCQYTQRRLKRCADVIWTHDEVAENETLPVVGILPLGEHAALLLQDSKGSIERDARERWLAFAQHAGHAWENAQTYASIPAADLQSKLFTAGDRFRGATRRRSLLFTAVGIAACALVALLPVPMIVSAPATLECLDRQVVYAPSDAVVDEVMVRNGDSVEPGDVLLRLADPLLDREVDDLIGQQNVLDQRRLELRAMMVTTRGARDESERIEGEHEIVQRQIDGIQKQIALARIQQEALTVRAKRSGKVVGWRLKEELADRPVRRSERLLQVIEPEGQWSLQVAVDQNRLDHVLDALSADDGKVRANVVFRAFPSQPTTGTLKSLDTITFEEFEGKRRAMAEVLVDTDTLPIHESGASATVTVACGKRPLVYVAFQDLIRSLGTAVRSYY